VDAGMSGSVLILGQHETFDQCRLGGARTSGQSVFGLPRSAELFGKLLNRTGTVMIAAFDHLDGNGGPGDELHGDASNNTRP
jgi:hypothetical protein